MRLSRAFGNLHRNWEWHSAEVIPGARWSKSWWWEVGVVRNSVYALTGSSVKVFIKPAVRRALNTMRVSSDRVSVVSLGVTLPIYPLVLLFYGTLLGRHHFFLGKCGQMLSRFNPFRCLGCATKSCARTSSSEALVDPSSLDCDASTVPGGSTSLCSLSSATDEEQQLSQPDMLITSDDEDRASSSSFTGVDEYLDISSNVRRKTVRASSRSRTATSVINVNAPKVQNQQQRPLCRPVDLPPLRPAQH
jgi:hypothetical protein